jgi:hypothetical protein
VTSNPQQDPPGAGGVHEETARLFAALEGAAAAWAGAGPRAATADPDQGRDGEDVPQGAGHLPTTCGVCPVCLALDHVGRRHPEVLTHLGEAVQALGAAFAALTTDARQQAAEGDGRAAADDGDHGRTPPRTERIDLDD